jgi:hypothetical protein
VQTKTAKISLLESWNFDASLVGFFERGIPVCWLEDLAMQLMNLQLISP